MKRWMGGERRRGNAERTDLTARQRQFFATNRQTRRLQRINATTEENSLLVPADPPPVFEGSCPAPKRSGPTSVIRRDRSELKFLKQLQTSNASETPIHVSGRSSPLRPARPQLPHRHISKPHRIDKKRLQSFDSALQFMQTRSNICDVVDRIPDPKRRRHAIRTWADQRVTVEPVKAQHTHARQKEVFPIEGTNGDDIIIFDEVENKALFHQRSVIPSRSLNNIQTRPRSKQRHTPTCDATNSLTYHPPKHLLPPSSLPLISDRFLFDSSFQRPSSKSSISERLSNYPGTVSDVRHDSWGETMECLYPESDANPRYRPHASRIQLQGSLQKGNLNGHTFSIVDAHLHSLSRNAANQEDQACNKNERPISMQISAPSQELTLPSKNPEITNLLRSSREDYHPNHPFSFQPFDYSSSESHSLVFPKQPKMISPEIRIGSPLQRPKLSHAFTTFESHGNILTRYPWCENKRSLELVYFENSLLKPDTSVIFSSKKSIKTANAPETAKMPNKAEGSQGGDKTWEWKKQIYNKNIRKSENEASPGIKVATYKRPELRLDAIDIELLLDGKNPIVE